MKTPNLNIKTATLAILFAFTFVLHSCQKEICEEERDDNFEHVSKGCNQKATVSKFYGEWEMTFLTFENETANYKISISSSQTLYTISLKSNYGYYTEPVESNYKVYQNKAINMEAIMIPSLDLKISNCIFEVNGSKATMKYVSTNISSSFAENILDNGVKK